MIEIINLTKTYNSISGQEVKALNGINLKFQDKGLTFIIGKSGSGKSTLLNLIGGLDSYDDGKIIIKGKSSKNFIKSEFDSFRNTYTGFIFQEFNLLEEYTIEKNISLALELQSKHPSEEEVKDVLEIVDLAGYEKRMPNELSSGQRQRVAIARVLIKNPNCILADEPTGALDSSTSKMVFELLKKFSKDKLIIVITHDKEFAYTYGDRVIELQDGMIIKDVNIDEGNNFKKSIKDDNKEESLKLIKSKLPLGDAFKLGVNNLKRKTFRLILTILLSAIAFTLFGIADIAASYDRTKTTLASIYDSDLKHLTINKAVTKKTGKEKYIYYPQLKNEDIQNLKSKHSQYIFNPVFKQYNQSLDSNLKIVNNETYYYITDIIGSIEITNEGLNNYGLSLSSGQLPNKSTLDDEIAVSQYVYSMFKQFGYFDIKLNKIIPINNETDLIGKSITLGSKEFIISGIINTNFNFNRYKALLDNSLDDSNAIRLGNELSESINYGLHNLLYFREGYYNDHFEKQKDTYLIDEIDDSLTIYFNQFSELPEENNYEIEKITKNLNDINKVYWLDGIQKTKLAKNEIIIPIDSIYENIYIDDNPSLLELQNDRIRDEISDFVEEHFHEIEDEYSSNKESYKLYILYSEENKYHQGMNYEYFKDIALNNILNEIYFPKMNSVKLYRSDDGQVYDKEVKVVGVYNYTKFRDNEIDNPIILSNELYDQFYETAEGDYVFLITTLKGNDQDNRFFKVDSKTISYEVHNEFTWSLEYVNNILESIARIFVFVGIGFLIFSSLLLYNFISNSIIYKKKTIGVLRSLGARITDIFKIFFIESLIIAILNFLISVGLCIVLSHSFNIYMQKETMTLIKFLSFGVRQISILLLITIIVAFISTYIPIKALSKKMPIDTIKSIVD